MPFRYYSPSISMGHNLPGLVLVEGTLQILPYCGDISLAVTSVYLAGVETPSKVIISFSVLVLEAPLCQRCPSARSLSGYALVIKVHAFFSSSVQVSLKVPSF